MKRVLVAIGVVLALITGVLASTATATLSTHPPLTASQQAQIRALDVQIATARKSVSGWRTWLRGWSQRIDRAELHLAQAHAVADTTVVSESRITALRAHVASVLDSQYAVTAMQQLTGWQTHVQTLLAERSAIMNGMIVGQLQPGAPISYEQWAGQLLGKLGDPACSENVTALVTWQAAESTAARFNPLATTHDMPGSTSMNPVGVRNYASLGQGLDATVETLQNGSPTYGYTSILDSLAACASADQTVAAVNASSWCSGCAFGGYVTNLLPIVRSDYRTYARRVVSAG
ncbi:MAG: hypothetical protein QOG88_1626 [Actinomycetota bacterium]|nr:hypothetical protein [Actinomycetota bacterium]